MQRVHSPCLLLGFIALLSTPLAQANCDRHVTIIDHHSSHCDIYAGFGMELPMECAGTHPKQSYGVGCTTPANQRVTRSIQQNEAPSAPPAQRSLAVQINFAFNSAELDGMSRSVLNQIAQALRQPNSFESGMSLEGHTDAVGSDHYNLSLSERRARAVHDYLVQHHSIERSRLRVEGKGKRNLLFPNDPTAAANRRVEFVVQVR